MMVYHYTIVWVQGIMFLFLSTNVLFNFQVSIINYSPPPLNSTPAQLQDGGPPDVNVSTLVPGSKGVVEGDGAGSRCAFASRTPGFFLTKKCISFNGPNDGSPPCRLGVSCTLLPLMNGASVCVVFFIKNLLY